MKTRTRHTVTSVATLLAVALLSGSASSLAAAAENTATDSITVSTYSDWGDPAMAKIAVDSGRALVDHLDSAKGLLATGRIRQARSALTTSREFADAIERTMPYLTVVEDMRNAGQQVTQEDVTGLRADLLPIYASLDELQLYAPKVAERTRGMVQKAEKNASAGDKPAATRLLTEAADDIAQHTVYLPVDYVDEQIHGALYAIDRPKPDVAAARAAVERALDSVTLVVDEVTASHG